MCGLLTKHNFNSVSYSNTYQTNVIQESKTQDRVHTLCQIRTVKFSIISWNEKVMQKGK